MPTTADPIVCSSSSVRLVSYPTQKVRLQWDGGDGGVVLNPELKLLQYNLGQPLEVAESIEYMPQKHGKINDCTGECSQTATTFQRFSCQLGHISEVSLIIASMWATRLALLTFAWKTQRFWFMTKTYRFSLSYKLFIQNLLIIQFCRKWISWFKIESINKYTNETSDMFFFIIFWLSCIRKDKRKLLEINF